MSASRMQSADGKTPAGMKDSPAAMRRVDDGIWASLSKTAKSLFTEEEELPRHPEALREGLAAKQSGDAKSPSGLQKSLDAITNSLSFIGDRVGTAIEESLDVISTKAVDFIEGPSPSLHQDIKRSPSIGLDGSPVTNQLKASRDVATAMVTKVRQYQRQVEAQKAQLDFATKRCMQLEEENKRLRDGLELQGKMEEDPLVRQQLEALLAEKARLARENTHLQRENEHLFELLAYSTQGLNRSPSVSAGVFEWERSEEERGAATPSRRQTSELIDIQEEGEVSSRELPEPSSTGLASIGHNGGDDVKQTPEARLTQRTDSSEKEAGEAEETGHVKPMSTGSQPLSSEQTPG